MECFFNSVYEKEFDGVRVFYADVSKLDTDTDYICISDYRREKLKKLKGDNKKMSLGVELLLIYAIEKYYPDIALPLVFTQNEHGKPVIKDYDIHFNLAHSSNISVCAVADRAVGVDVESKFRVSDTVKKRCFTQNEYDSEFYHIWTRKEAVAKAEGSGISLGFDSFSVLDDIVVIDKTKYRLTSFDAGLNDAYISLCVQSDVVRS